MDFSGKTILITGAASGIGLASAEFLASKGAARLILIDREAQTLERITLPCEIIRSAGTCRAKFSGITLELGSIDHAIVNAGVAAAGPILDLKFAEWRRVMAVNLDGAFLTLRAALASSATGLNRGRCVRGGDQGRARHRRLCRLEGRNDPALTGCREGGRPAQRPRECDRARWRGDSDLGRRSHVRRNGQRKSAATRRLASLAQWQRL